MSPSTGRRILTALNQSQKTSGSRREGLCAGRNRRGGLCERRALEGSPYCKAHRYQAAEVVAKHSVGQRAASVLKWVLMTVVAAYIGQVVGMPFFERGQDSQDHRER